VSFFSGGNWTSDPRERSGQQYVRPRRAVRSDQLAEATLACPRCDAPVAIGTATITVAQSLTCPFCGHHGAARTFLSLARPTRPAHVVLRVSFGGQR
jgi:uncharacterized paraquat-inducible protein A